MSLEHAPQDGAQRFIVFNRQDRLGAVISFAEPGLGRRRRDGRSALCHREVHRERRSSPRFTLGRDVAAALADDAVDRRKPESGTFALLRRERRFEDHRQVFGLDPGARIIHRHGDVVPGATPRVLRDECLVERRAFRADRHPPAVRHRVGGVDDEVVDGLLDLAGVAVDIFQTGTELPRQFDVRSDHRPHRLLEVRGERREVQVHGPHRLLSAEREQLAGQRRRALSHSLDLLHVTPVRRCRGHRAEEEVAVAEDPCQQIVEVVRDTTREAAGGFEALRLDECRSRSCRFLQRPLALERIVKGERESGDILLEDIVPGACLETSDGPFVIERARQDDDWRVGVLGGNEGHGLETGHGRHREVGQDDFRGNRSEGGDERGWRVDSVPGEFETALVEHPDGEGDVGSLVFHEQQVHGEQPL